MLSTCVIIFKLSTVLTFCPQEREIDRVEKRKINIKRVIGSIGANLWLCATQVASANKAITLNEFLKLPVKSLYKFRDFRFLHHQKCFVINMPHQITLWQHI